MALVLTAPPAAEPVSLAEVKAQARIDSDDEDELLASLITTARTHIERTLGLAMLTQGWSYYLDGWPRTGCINLPITPVQTVSAVKRRSTDGAMTEIAADDYTADVLSMPARVLLGGHAATTALQSRLNNVEVDFVAGYGDAPDDVPPPIRQALRSLVAHWFDRRELVVLGETVAEVPSMVESLLLPFRRIPL